MWASTPGWPLTPAPGWPAAPAWYPVPSQAYPRGVTDRSLGVWGWATALGVVGLGSSLRGLNPILAGTAPAWYEPTLAALGLGGLLVAAAAVGSTRYRRLPWIMLALATLPLGLSLALAIGTRWP